MGENGDMVEQREPGPHKRDNIVSTGLAADTFRDFEQYRADNDLTSKSEAANRLFRSGLSVEKSNGVFILTNRMLILGAIFLAGYVASPPDPLTQVIGGLAMLLASVGGALEVKRLIE